MIGRNLIIGIMLLILGVLSLLFWWTGICCLVGLICGALGLFAILYGVLASKPRPVVLKSERTICPYCYRPLRQSRWGWYCSTCGYSFGERK